METTAERIEMILEELEQAYAGVADVINTSAPCRQAHSRNLQRAGNSIFSAIRDLRLTKHGLETENSPFCGSNFPN